MTDMDCACLVRELMEYNSNDLLRTPQMAKFDTMFQCALEHALRALEEKSGVSGVVYTKNPNGSFDWEAEKKQERSIHYRTKSLKQLLSCYSSEVCRLNYEDKKVTQDLIRQEIDARVQVTFNALDSSPEMVEQIYKQFVEH